MMFWLSLLVVLLAVQQNHGGSDEFSRMRGEAEARFEQHRKGAIRVNEKAARIATEQDAEDFVSLIAQTLADALPPDLVTPDLRHRIAAAEHKTVTNPVSLIPEAKVTVVWNEYVREIGAPDEVVVTTQELHTLRDLKYSSSKWLWAKGRNQTLWTIPNIYAVKQDGKLADGCRAIEALSLLHELHLFNNVRTARGMAAEGIVPSERIREVEQRENTGGSRGSRFGLVAAKGESNPVRDAERRFVNSKGSAAMYLLLARLSDELLPPLSE